ncbi:uncharacterized protein LOC126743479 [Anthonomus grandis grandis]|uniref:uncharacterized protein LOC126743479 n=1 Tax=Anthonomus grandis grandis TaxID=2921223 RepID=UPI0021660718|nr:uncharacterized protein LOC126743479 [Anthonomus grandis grandis]
MIFLYTRIQSLYIFLTFTLLFYPGTNGTSIEDCEPIRTSGTGTVLFNPTDVFKTCWSQEEIAIITARIILEDVIPDRRLISIQCNDDVEDFITYFKEVIETIRGKTKARKRHIMLLALTDLLGGYLHHVILPMARKAYYSGAVDYLYMEKLIQLYEEIKWFLRTNGQGWTKPMVVTKDVKTPLINMDTIHNNVRVNDTSCKRLMYFEHEPLRTKRSVSVEKGIYFPLPFFDAKLKPTAIALPLKRYGLRNIESRRAACVVMKFFILAEECLKDKSAKSDMVQKFRNNLYTWIEKDVVPKLPDDKFYSAFGGILRVQATLKSLGAKIGNQPCNPDEGEEEINAVPGIGCSSRRNKLFLIAMLVIIVAWFLIGTCFICYRMKNNREGKPKGYNDEGSSKDATASSSSFSSSKWSSVLSKSSSKSSKQLCKCCESSLSEKSTTNYTSTSEYDSEKSRKARIRGSRTFRKSKSSACVCPSNGPAIIDAKNSVKVLPSIAEMSEQSVMEKNQGSFRKISFADESGVSSSDGGKICVPPWTQRGSNMIPCPVLSEKNGNYSSSMSNTMKSHNLSEAPLASSSRMDNQTENTSRHEGTQLTGKESVSAQFDEPLANSTFKQETFDPNLEQSSSEHKRPFSTATNTSYEDGNRIVKKESYRDNEKPRIKEEPGIKKEPSFDDPGNDILNYHAAACHSSISGSYDLYHKTDPNKPYIFGYDFQTTTSSDLSDDD